MKRHIIYIALFLSSFAVNAQIDINTNFSVLSNQPIDSRDTLTTLADTAFVTWTYEGLLAWAADVNQFWVYNGGWWEQLATGGGTPLATTDQTLTAPRTIIGSSTNTLTFDSGTADGTPDVIFNDGITIQGNTKISTGTNPTGNSVIIGANTAPNLNAANNVIIGDSAFFNVSGGATVPDNVIIGGSSGVENKTGRYLTFVGAWAGQKNRTGLDNTAVGQLALQYNDDGNFYTALGYGAGRRARIDSTGGLGLSAENVFLGWSAGHGPLTGPYNSGRRNLFVGYQSGFYHQTGDDNTLVGFRSGENGNGNNWNVSLGGKSLLNLTSGDFNTSLGGLSGENTSVGIRNIYLGYAAGNNVVDGSDNIIIGANMNASSASASNEFIAGFNSTDFLSYNKAASGEWIMQGGIQLPSYASGAKDGTAIKYLGLDTNNKLVTFSAGSGSGIYGGSGSLSGATTITQATNNLTFSTNGSANSLVINGANGTASFGTTTSHSTYSAVFGKHAGFSTNAARFSWFDSGIIGMETDAAVRLIVGENATGGYWVKTSNMGVNRLPDAGGAAFVTQGNNEFYTNATANRTIYLGTLDTPNTSNEGINIEVNNAGTQSQLRERGEQSEMTLAAGLSGNQNDTYIKITSGDNTLNAGGIEIKGGQPNSDLALKDVSIEAASANASSTTNTEGANVIINGGAKAIAGTNDGSVLLATTRGNVGIGTTSPNSSAILDVASTTKGAIPFPKMTTTQRNNITSPVEGLTVHNTTTNQPNYFDGTAWKVLGEKTDTVYVLREVAEADDTAPTTTGLIEKGWYRIPPHLNGYNISAVTYTLRTGGQISGTYEVAIDVESDGAIFNTTFATLENIRTQTGTQAVSTGNLIRLRVVSESFVTDALGLSYELLLTK